MVNDEDLADGEDIILVEDDIVGKIYFISEDEEESDNEDAVANESDVADEENTTSDEGDVLDIEDTFVDEGDEARTEDMVLAKDVVADVADGEDMMVDEDFGLMPHADESLSAWILCQLPLWSVQL